MAGGIEGFLRQLTYFGGAAIVTGALLYGPISGMGYGPYASGALIVVAAGAGGTAAMYALSLTYN